MIHRFNKKQFISKITELHLNNIIVLNGLGQRYTKNDKKSNVLDLTYQKRLRKR